MYTRIDKILKDPYSDRQDSFVVNHLENIQGICTKTGLVKTLKHYYKNNSEASKTPIQNLFFLNYS